jgi:hypothetical protein
MDNPIRNFIAEGPTDHGGDSDIIWKLRVKSNLILKLTYKIIFFYKFTFRSSSNRYEPFFKSTNIFNCKLFLMRSMPTVVPWQWHGGETILGSGLKVSNKKSRVMLT